MSARGAGGYARAIERAWGRRVQRPVVLSPRDWARVADWHARGIPLDVVEEALEEASARAARRGKLGPRRLASVAPAVEESWLAIVDGRTGEETPSQAPPRSESEPAAAAGEAAERALRRWREMAAESEHALGIGATLDAFENGRLAADEANALLDRELPKLAAPALVERVRAQVERRLAGYGGRLEPEQMEQTRRQAGCEGLRRALGLPRLGNAS